MLAPALFNRQTPAAIPKEFTPPEFVRAIVIDPATQAVTLEAIDSQLAAHLKFHDY